jgi:NAD(P)H-hydrate epimerase
VTEVVARPLSAIGFSSAVLDELDRCAALVLGPGLGQRDGTASEVRHLVDESPVPVVLDADGLNALAPLPASPAAKRRASLILTPHDGEYARLAGAPVGEDRVAAARALALRSDAVVLLKGPTTIVADPLGAVRFVNSGSARLATAGTGDVLSGVIGALLARGLDPLHAAALGAHLHGRAAALGYREGLVAGDLPELLARVLSDLESDGGA